MNLRTRLQRGSISLRLALVFALLMASVLTGASALLYVNTRAALDRSIADRLRLRWEDVGELAPDTAASKRSLAQDIVTRTDGAAQAFDRDGTLLATTRSVAHRRLATADQVAALRRHAGTVHQRHEPHEGRLAVYGGIPFHGAPVVVIATERRDRDEALEQLLRELVIGSAIVVVLSTLVSYAISRGALAPVETVRRQAAALANGADDRLLDVPQRRDEIARLARTLNQLLERLYASVARERRFVADAGHELRTPLAIAQGEVELLLGSTDLSAGARSALEAVLGELHALAHLGQRLLDMGGIAHNTMATTRVHVSDLITRAIERQRLAHPERDGALVTSDVVDAEVSVDLQLVDVALANLIDNAFGYGCAPVTLSAAATETGVTITVSDAGDGFPATFIDSAFDPFTRADDARTSSGSGIGLAIVRDVMHAHGGTANIAVGTPTAVTLSFPRA